MVGNKLVQGRVIIDILTLSLSFSTSVVCFVVCSCSLEASMANSMDLDQTAPYGAV